MKDFVYYAPTKVYFGKGRAAEVGPIAAGYGFKTVMVQYGQGSVKRSGLYDQVMDSLKGAGITVVELGGVEPNPKVELVREAIKLCREKGVELVLAVGGGSVIDSCKYTALGAMYDGDVWDIPARRYAPDKALPVAAIITHAAAGSEMSGSAVLTNLGENMKRGFGSDLNRCLFAICDPELTYTVSPYQTACGIVDLMTHTIERYFTLCPPTELTDRLAEGLLLAVIDAGRRVMADPEDYDARADILWASSLAHNDLTGCGRENLLAVHQLEHALSGEYDHVAHGAGLAVLYPAWARYVYREDIPRFARFARNVWGVTETEDDKAALAGIDAMAAYFAELGMPGKLRDFGVSEESLPKLADLCTYHGTRVVKSYIPLDYDTSLAILKSCY